MVWYGTVRYGMICYGMVQYVRFCMVLCGIVYAMALCAFHYKFVCNLDGF